ncbi:hypothetical protein BJ742DRAFT_798807 [Cladochytrium replicatum]|nr:hypothetical protein BJ742DRAFT_798807 [Cladochytrium replicatum]
MDTDPLAGNTASDGRVGDAVDIDIEHHDDDDDVDVDDDLNLSDARGANPSRFLRTVLVTVLDAISSLPADIQSRAQVRHALSASSFALEFIDLVDPFGGLSFSQSGGSSLSGSFQDPNSLVFPFEANGHDNATHSSNAGASPPLQSPSELISMAAIPSVRKSHQRRPLYRNIPPEILMRILSFVCANSPDSDAGVSFGDRLATQTLYSCCLVNRHWNRQSSSILWRRIDLPSERFGKWVLGVIASSTSARRAVSVSRVRVLGVTGTDVDLALLSMVASQISHPNGLHSLEIQRSRVQGAASYRLLPRIVRKFAWLRSLVADSIPPSAWKNVVKLCNSCSRLKNLHISFSVNIEDMTDGNDNGSSSSFGAPNPTPTNADMEEIFSSIPELQTLTFWRIPLPGDIQLCAPLSQHCINLRAVRLDDCGNLSMDSLVHIWNRCPQIEVIAMRRITEPVSFAIACMYSNQQWNTASINTQTTSHYETPPTSALSISTQLSSIQIPSNSPVSAESLPIGSPSSTLSSAVSNSIHLTSRPNLRTLLLDGCWASDALVSAIGRASPNLRILYLESSDASDVTSGVTDAGIRALAAHQHHLRSISLVGFVFSPTAILQLLRSNPRVVGLNIARLGAGAYLTDEHLIELSPGFATLEALELYMQSHLSEAGLIQALANGPRLRSLGLSDVGCVTDRFLSVLPRLCPDLERIDIGGVGYSDRGVEVPAALCTAKGLQMLVNSAGKLRECVVPEGIESERNKVKWGKVAILDDPVTQEWFSEYGVWESEVRRVAKRASFVY